MKPHASLKTFLLGLWLLGVCGMTYTLLNYQSSPCDPGSPPKEWPSETPWKLNREHGTLLLFIHPGCPCTDASVELLAREGPLIKMARIDTRVVVFKPPHLRDQWAYTDLWDAAARLPGVKFTIDSGGTICQKFGVRTSGHVLLYSPGGVLIFTGGVTLGRGHAVGNSNSQLLHRQLLSPEREAYAPVYGCGLFEEKACKEDFCAIRR